MVCREQLVSGLKQTSIKGVPRLFKVESLTLRLLWALAVLTFLTVGFYQSVELILEYFSYPKLTIVKEAQFSLDKDYVFPSIQVCNVNQQGLLRDVPSNETVDYYNKLVEERTKCPDCTDEDQSILLRTRARLRSFYGYVDYLGVTKALSVRKNYSEFMIECLVFQVGASSGVKCDDLVDVRVIFSLEYFLCFRINFREDVMIDKVTMTFYVDNLGNEVDDYNSDNIWAKQSSGVAYSVVNSEAKDVSPATQFTAPPGVSTSVEIHKENYKRLSEPYGQCSSSECSRDDCILQCYKTKLVENCNCIVLEEYDPKGNENLTFCLSVHHSPSQLVENLRCVESVNNGILDACFAFCKPKCEEVRYKTQASYTKWPLPHQFTSFYNKLIKDQPFSAKFDILDPNNHSNNEDIFMMQFKSLLKKQLVEDNFLKIDFTLSVKAFREFVEVPEFSLSAFLGSLGGILNLWTGITVVVFVEFIEIIFNIIFTCNVSSESRQDN